MNNIDKIMVGLAKTIKIYCGSHKTCSDCVFHTEPREQSICALIPDSPFYWNLPKIEEESDEDKD